MKAIALFAVVVVLVVAGLGVVLAIPFSSPSERRAIEVSAIVAKTLMIASAARNLCR